MLTPVETLRALVQRALPELWARRWLMAAGAWTVAVLGTLVVAALPNTYTSTARVYVDTQSLLKPLLNGLTVQPDLQQKLAIMRQTLMTRPNMEQLIRMTDLDLTVQGPVGMEELVEELKRDIRFKAEGQELFSIAYSNRGPDLAHKVVQSLLTIFIEQNLGNNRRDIEKTQRFIGEQIADYERRLRETETKVAEFRRVHGEQLVGKETLSRTLQQAESQIQQMEMELQSAVWTGNQIGIELARTPRTIQAGSAGTPGLTPLQAQEQELAQLRLRYTDDHPDVREALRRLEGLKTQPAQTGAAVPGGIANPQYADLAAKARENELKVGMLTHRLEGARQQAAAIKRQIEELPSLEIELAEMNRDYEVLHTNYQELIARRESARLAQQVDDRTQAVDYRVVDPPLRPLQPSGPPRLLLMGLVALLSAATGAGLGVLAVQLRSGFHSIEQLRDAFGVDVIGAVTANGALARGPGLRAKAAIAGNLVLLVGLLTFAAVVLHLSQTLGSGPGAAQGPAAYLNALRTLWP